MMFKQKLKLISLVFLLLMVFITISSVSAQSISDSNTDINSDIPATDLTVVHDQNILENNNQNGILGIGTDNDVLGAKVAPDFSVTPNGTVNVNEGDNVTFTVTGPNNVTGLIIITGDKEGVISNFNGNAQKSFEFLNEGTYTLNFTYYENDDYLSDSVVIPVQVSKQPISVYDLPIAATNITYNVTDVVISVKLPAGAKKDGLNISVDGTIYPSADYIWDESTNLVTLNISNLDAGKYLATAEYGGDGIYEYNLNQTSFTVNKDPSSIEIEMGEYYFVDDDVEITLKPSYDSPIKVIVNSVEYEVSANNTVTLKSVANGTYNVAAILEGDKNHNLARAKTTFYVNKLVPEIKVTPEIPGGWVGNDVKFNITGPDDRIGMVVISGDLNYVIDSFNGTYGVSFSDLKPGYHYVNITYVENDKYSKETISTFISVLPKRVVPMDVDDVVIDYGERATVIVTGLDSIAGQTITITAGNIKRTATVSKKGTGTASFNNLNAGEYAIVATYGGDDTHYAATANATLTVNKASTSVDIEVDEYYFVDDDVVISLNTSSDLPVKVIVNSVEYEVSANNTVTLESVANGTYVVAAIVEGDENHHMARAKTTFYVNKLVPEIIVTPKFPGGWVGNDVKFNITGPDDRIGMVVISGDLNYVIDSFNGTYGVSLSDLKPGYHNVNVTYVENDKYSKETISALIIVLPKMVVPMDVDDVVIDYGECAEVIVTGLNGIVGQNITIAAGNIKRNVTISNNGTATADFNNLNAGEYAIVVTYGGDDSHYAATANATLYVTPVDTTIDIEVDEIYYAGEDVDIIITLNDDATGYVDIIIDNTEHLAEITDSMVVYTIEDAQYGEHSIYVVYLGDNNHNKAISDEATFDVEKMGSVLYIDSVETDSSNNKTTVYINITDDEDLPFDISGDVTVYVISDELIIKEITVDVDECDVAVDLGEIYPGLYTIAAVYNGNDYYDMSNEDYMHYTVPFVTNYELPISAINGTYGETEIVIGVALPDEGNIDYLLISIGNNTYTSEDFYQIENLVLLSISNIDAGTYLASAIYGDDGIYDLKTNSTSFTVFKAPSSIDIDVDESYFAGDDVVIDLIPSFLNSTVTVTINGKEYEVSSDNTVTLKAVNGTYMVVAKLADDNNHIGSQTNATFYVYKVIPEISVHAPDSYFGDDQFIIIDLPTDATGLVTAEVDDALYAAHADNGTAVIVVHNLNPGDYTAIVTYQGDDKYELVDTSVEFKVEDRLEVSAPDVVKYYHGSERFEVEVIFNKQPLEGQLVLITINGVQYKRTTDKYGIASIGLNLNSGEYSVLVNVDDLEINSSVTVLSTVSGEDIAKVFRNGTQYQATFTDSQGKVLANKMVTFNINGVFYNRTTDAYGVAKLNINLQPGEYIITALNPVTGESWSNNIEVLSHFVEHDDLDKIYGSSTPFVVRLCDDHGNIAGRGELVTLNINGVFYNKTSDSDGYVRLNINLQAGEYIITSIYNDESVSNKITVRPEQF